MPRISAVSSPNASSLLAGSILLVSLVSLTFAPPSRADGPTGAGSDPCAGPSQRYGVAPSGASLLALASCHEQRGKTASAWAEYLEAATLAHREKRPDVETSAKDHAASLERRLSTLAVRVAQGAILPGLEVRRDGITLGHATWGTPAPVDPGEHHVEATAPGHLPWRRTIVVRPGAGAQSVEVGPLEDDSKPEVAATTLTSATVGGDDAPSSRDLDRPAAAPRTGSGQRAVGLATAGVGLVGLGLGTYFGIRTLDQSDAARRACPASPCADRSAVEKNDQAKSSSLISTMSFAAGGGVFLLGSILFFTAPSASSQARAKPVRAKTFDVAVAPAFTGLRWRGDF